MYVQQARELRFSFRTETLISSTGDHGHSEVSYSGFVTSGSIVDLQPLFMAPKSPSIFF